MKYKYLDSRKYLLFTRHGDHGQHEDGAAAQLAQALEADLGLLLGKDVDM